MLFTILAGAKRHRLEPWAYLRDVLLRLSAGETDLESLLPDRWAASHPEHVLQHRLDESRRKAARQKATRDGDGGRRREDRHSRTEGLDDEPRGRVGRGHPGVGGDAVATRSTAGPPSPPGRTVRLLGSIPASSKSSQSGTNSTSKATRTTPRAIAVAGWLWDYGALKAVSRYVIEPRLGRDQIWPPWWGQFVA